MPDDVEVRRLVSEAAVRMDEAYRHIRMSVHQRRYLPDGRRTPAEQADLLYVLDSHYARHGDMALGVQTVTQSNDPQNPVGLRVVFGGSAEDYFVLQKVPDADRIELLRRFPNNHFQTVMSDRARPLFRPYFHTNIHLEDFFSNVNDVTILEAVLTVFEGQEAFAVLTRYDYDDPGRGRASNHVRFYFRTHDWVMIGSESFMDPAEPEKSTGITAIDYVPDSVPPRLQRLDLFGRDPADVTRRIGGMTYEVVDFAFERTDPGDFTPENFGVEIEEGIFFGDGLGRDAGPAASVRRVALAWIGLLASAVLALAGVFLAWRSTVVRRGA